MVPGHRAQGRVEVAPRERGHAGEALVQGHAQRPQVGRDAGRGVAQALGRHVGGRPPELHRMVLGGDVHDLRDAEVGEHDPPVGADQDVRRLHVAMQDTDAVRGLQRRQHRQAHPPGPLGGQRAVVAEHLLQAAAPDVLHDDQRIRLHVLDVVDPDHAAVVQIADPYGSLGLTQHVAPDLRGGRAGRNDLLDRYLAVQQGVSGEPHPGHAAAPDQRKDLVVRGKPGNGAGGHSPKVSMAVPAGQSVVRALRPAHREAQATHMRAVGRASSRAGGIGSPQLSHTP